MKQKVQPFKPTARTTQGKDAEDAQRQESAAAAGRAPGYGLSPTAPDPAAQGIDRLDRDMDFAQEMQDVDARLDPSLTGQFVDGTDLDTFPDQQLDRLDPMGVDPTTEAPGYDRDQVLDGVAEDSGAARQKRIAKAFCGIVDVFKAFVASDINHPPVKRPVNMHVAGTGRHVHAHSHGGQVHVHAHTHENDGQHTNAAHRGEHARITPRQPGDGAPQGIAVVPGSVQAPDLGGVAKTEWTREVPVWFDKAEAAGSDDGLPRVVYGVVLVPGQEDSQGDVVTAEDIEKAAHAFMRDYRQQGIEHVGAAIPEIEPLESYIAPADITVGGQLVLKGSWVLASGLNSVPIRKAVRDGLLGSYSMQGMGVRIPLDDAAA